MSAKATALLSSFINRIEQQPDRIRRVMAKPPPFDSLAEREAFESMLRQAERLGAVEIVQGKRGARHLIDRIILKDSGPLYSLLGRTTLEERVTASVARLRAVVSSPLPDTEAVMAEIEAGWASRKQPYGFDVDDPDVVDFVRALDAVLRRDPADRSDLRTFSRRATGDSKLVERHRPAIAGYLRRSGRFPARISEPDLFTAIGLEKFPQPVLIAGPVSVGDCDLSSLPFVGLPADAIEDLRPTRPIRTVLSIENLASFNRHVREARREDDVVIYSGGFPARATLQAMKLIFAWCPGHCLHWGDIDPYGIEIALYIARSTGVDLHPHLMTAAIARRHGKPSPPATRLDANGTAFAAVAEALTSEWAYQMEQEEIDPQSPP